MDAGNNTDVLAQVDIDAQPRIQPSEGRVDIGADESDGTNWSAGPYAVVRVSPMGNDANDGSSWPSAKRTVQSGINAASALGGEVWVQRGTYEENIRLRPYAYVYGGFAGDEATRDDRDWRANVSVLRGLPQIWPIQRGQEQRSSILGSQQKGAVVSAEAGYGETGAVDGFTIINGDANYGGGLYVWNASPTIANNTVMDNNAWRGGGLFLSWSSSKVFNNTITGNSAYHGGGISLHDDASPEIVNNTVAGNRAYDGGGLYLENAYPTIANTIVAFNSSGVHQNDAGGTATLRFNCVYGNDAYDYFGLADPTGADGNISADPSFADLRYGNTHLQPNSPCVDAGNNSDALGEFDADGERRIQPPGGRIDIGVDESNGTVWTEGPNTRVHVSPAGDDANDGSCWASAKRTVQAGIDAASVLRGEVWVQSAKYEERITLRPYAFVYGGFAGSELLRDERNWVTNVTTLDGQQQGTVVTAQTGFGLIAAVDGFTITRGRAHAGGGLYIYGSSPAVANNIVTGNAGVAINLDSSSATIANNTILRNGGGLYMIESSPAIVNNTIAKNRGGLYLSASSPTIANTIVTFNRTGIRRNSSGFPALRFNCVYGNTEYDYSGLDDPTGTDGNISADPRLAGPQYGNMHIEPDSPCVDAGNNADAWSDYDTDGEPRIQPAGGTVDVGSDESDGTIWGDEPYTIVRVSSLSDDANDGSSWALAKRTVQAGIDEAWLRGGEVWVQAGTYEELIDLPPYAFVYGGFAGVETVRDDRDWRTNVTILDGQQQGSVVTAQAGWGAVGVVDGFTITGGLASHGGGLHLRHSGTTVTNNTIVGNRADIGGGGVLLDGSTATVAGNTITRNVAHQGGGLLLFDCSSTVANNTIVGNSADGGGGLYVRGSSPIIVNNSVTGNSAIGDGGGLSMIYSAPVIANNTIAGNIADNGGGLYLAMGSSPTITNTIVAHNSSGVFQVLQYAGTPTMQHNCVNGNAEYDYASLVDPTGINGNISADPLFLQLPDAGLDGVWGTPDDDFGDLQLLTASPCIDAGDNEAVPEDTIDLDGDGDITEPLPIDLAGEPRYVDAPLTADTGNGTPPIVDMGAYEYQPDWLVDLETAVVALQLPHGIERSLLVKLDTAARLLEDGNPRNDAAACNAIHAFMHTVQAHSGRQVSEAEAATLIDIAHQTIEALGCPDKPAGAPGRGFIMHERRAPGG